MATISAHHVRSCLLSVAPEARERLLLQAGIHPRRVPRRADSRVHADAVARLFRGVQRHLNDEFLGFASEACAFGVFELLCDSLLRHRRLGAALAHVASFYSLTCPGVQAQWESQRGRLSFVLSDPTRDPAHFLAEYLLVIWHRVACWLIGAPITLQCTDFAHTKPAHSEELRIMFGRTRFGAADNAIEFDPSWAQQPILRSDAEMAAFLAAHPSNIMTIPGARPALESRIEHLLRQRRHYPTLAQLAAELSMHPMALYRELRSQGRSYQHIKDDMRREQAIRALRSGMSVEHVAEHVGYAEARSFSRAFKLWTGMSPRAFARHAS